MKADGAGGAVSPETAALRRFARDGSREAFAAVTERYTGLVYHAAWRRTGSRELAEEVAQNVFAVLARKAAAVLLGEAPLAAWLHRAAVLEAARALRGELARQRMMKAYTESQDNTRPENPAAARLTDDLLPELDEGLNGLPRGDRELLLGRYFEERSYRELSAATGRSEAALMQQHHRALEKLARFFHRRGRAVTVTALASGLGAPLSSAAPAGLAAACAAGATGAAAGVSVGGILYSLSLLAMQIKTVVTPAAAVLFLLTGTGAFFTGRWQRDREVSGVTAPTEAGGKPGASGGSRAPSAGADPAALLADLPRPTAAEVLAAEGQERVEKLVLWAAAAVPAELGEMLERVTADMESATQRTEQELILQRWVEVDVPGAFAAARKAAGYTWMACTAWGRLRPAEAWAAAGKMDNTEKGYVLAGIVEADPRLAEEIISTSRDLDVLHKGRAQGELAMALARRDPRLGWDYALRTGAMARGSPAAAWIREAPDEAAAFALSRPDQRQRLLAVSELLGQLSASHPEKVEPLIASLPEGRLKWRALEQRARTLEGTDFEAAAAYAQNPALTAPARAALTQALAARWAETRPEHALALLRGLDWELSGQEGETPEIRTSDTPAAKHAGESKAAEALHRLAEHGHLSEALEVAGAVPPGLRRDQALGAVAAGWPAAEMESLAEWLDAQDTPSVREAGARRLVRHLVADKEPDFEAAASWAAILPTADKPGESELVEVMRKWREKDAAAAGAHLKTLAVTDETRAAIEKP